MKKIKAVVMQEALKPVFEMVDMPVRKTGEALLKVKYAGVCGSDLKVYLGTMNNVTYPIISGHEFSAEVVEVDDIEHGFKPGMLVAVAPYFGCGTCYCCQKGYFNCCQNNKTMGVGRDGCYQEYVSIPLEKMCDGKTLGAKTLAMVEPFANSMHLIKRTKVKAGDKMLIFGSGPIGVFAMLASKHRGAEVYMADISEKRLEYAMKLGADGVVNVADQKIDEWVRSQTGDAGFDICIEAVGSPSVFVDCLNSVSYRGKVMVIGVTKKEFSFNQTIISMKEIELVGSRNSQREDLLDVIDILSKGEIDISGIVTSHYSFDQVPQMFKDLEASWSENLKVLVEF